MSKPYGKFPNRYRKTGRQGGGPNARRNLRIKLNGRYDLEHTCQLLQRVIARLQDANVASIQNCALYLTPLGPDGDPMVLRDENGEPLETIEIAMPVAEVFDAASTM